MLIAPPISAKVLFYDPASGDPAAAEAAPSSTTGLTPVRSGGVQHVGVHYWFEDSRGERFADPAAAGAGSRITLHVRGNVGAFLTVWMSDATHASVELTSRTDAGPDGRWTGEGVRADQTVVISREFVVASPAEEPARVIIFVARSQTEQVTSFAGAREKLQRIAARTANDGDSVIVQEVDRMTRGQIGTYVVHRMGGQTAGEIVMAGQPPAKLAWSLPIAERRSFK